MKKYIITLLVSSAIFYACNNNKENESEDLVNPTPLTGVENVNGNIPDTTNAIRLGDTTVIDTMRR